MDRSRPVDASNKQSYVNVYTRRITNATHRKPSDYNQFRCLSPASRLLLNDYFTERLAIRLDPGVKNVYSGAIQVGRSPL